MSDLLDRSDIRKSYNGTFFGKAGDPSKMVFRNYRSEMKQVPLIEDNKDYVMPIYGSTHDSDFNYIILDNYKHTLQQDYVTNPPVRPSMSKGVFQMLKALAYCEKHKLYGVACPSSFFINQWRQDIYFFPLFQSTDISASAMGNDNVEWYMFMHPDMVDSNIPWEDRRHIHREEMAFSFGLVMWYTYAGVHPNQQSSPSSHDIMCHIKNRDFTFHNTLLGAVDCKNLQAVVEELCGVNGDYRGAQYILDHFDY